METVYRLIDAVLMRFGSGFCPHCHRFGWCNFIWNAGRERFELSCVECFLGQLGITREHYKAILEPLDDEDSETLGGEEPVTKSELIRTLIGLMLIDALFTFGFRYWADHDPRVASSFVYWFIIPMVSVLVIGMAALQLYWYSVRCSDIDVWMPSAGPSIELLTAFHMRSIVWEEFLTLYQVDQQNQRACCVVTYAGG